MNEHQRQAIRERAAALEPFATGRKLDAVALDVLALLDALEAAERECEALRAALSLYGWHSPSCGSGKCTCGYSDLIQ